MCWKQIKFQGADPASITNWINNKLESQTRACKLGLENTQNHPLTFLKFHKEL